MKARLRILSAGPGTTIQDGGRSGYLRYGVTVAGPMDVLSHATANMAVGSEQGAAVLEVSLGGITFTVESSPVMLAIIGSGFIVSHDGAPVPSNVKLRLHPGETLSIRSGSRGAWCYVALQGKIDLPVVLGSLSTHVRSHLGGFQGRALQAGDTIPLRIKNAGRACETETIDAPWLERPGHVMRVLAGPQDDYFSADQISIFEAGAWILSPRSDRMAYQLEGPHLVHSRGFNIVSDGVAFGAIQVPGNGYPIILMADRQPTGGYPKIANVIGADLGKLAQMRPGDSLRFKFVSVESAVEALREQQRALAKGPLTRPLIRTTFTSEFLLERNLISGFTA